MSNKPYALLNATTKTKYTRLYQRTLTATCYRRYQHFAEKYSVGCVQMTNDGIENYILGVS
jgi:hypothetical protein